MVTGHCATSHLNIYMLIYIQLEVKENRIVIDGHTYAPSHLNMHMRYVSAGGKREPRHG